jgi:hypothetical protein
MNGVKMEKEQKKGKTNKTRIIILVIVLQWLTEWQRVM